MFISDCTEGTWNQCVWPVQTDITRICVCIVFVEYLYCIRILRYRENNRKVHQEIVIFFLAIEIFSHTMYSFKLY